MLAFQHTYFTNSNVSRFPLPFISRDPSIQQKEGSPEDCSLAIMFAWSPLSVVLLFVLTHFPAALGIVVVVDEDADRTLGPYGQVPSSSPFQDLL